MGTSSRASGRQPQPSVQAKPVRPRAVPLAAAERKRSTRQIRQAKARAANHSGLTSRKARMAKSFSSGDAR